MDLPAFGNPTSAASASSFSSSRSHRSSPYSPCSAKLGAARSTGSARCRARPGRRAASQRSPWRTRSASNSLSGPYTTVPSGTSTTRSLPPTPCCFLPEPCVPEPRLAVRVVAEREQRRDVAAGAQPDVAAPAAVAAVGTARGTCDSRRNATQPAPPSPPFTLHCATSTKPDTPDRIRTLPRTGPPVLPTISDAPVGRPPGSTMMAIVRYSRARAEHRRRPEPTTTRPASTTSTATRSSRAIDSLPALGHRPRASPDRSLTGPPSPVSCKHPRACSCTGRPRAATSVRSASTAAMRATHPNGTHDELVPLACDGTRRHVSPRSPDGRAPRRR